LRLEGAVLYDGGRAPNPRRVQIFMAEKGVEVERIQLDLNRHEHQSPQFTAINPMQRVPVLVLADGTAIAETIAICRYLEEIAPEPPLMGKGAAGKAMSEMWQRRVEFGWLLPVGMAFRHLHPGGAVLEQPQIGQWGEVNQGRAVEFMEFLDRELASRRFIAGEDFSVADITAIVSCQFMKPARIAFPENLAHLKRWRDEVAARPSVALNP
jgi:glutathione S-transferase